MKLLLDTNIVIWMTGRWQRIAPTVLTNLSDQRNELIVSTASLVEIAAKVSRGRLDFTDELLRDLEQRVRFLPVSAAHAWHVRQLPLIHGDPFDRIIVAQAMLENMTLVTGDRLLLDYGVPTILT